MTPPITRRTFVTFLLALSSADLRAGNKQKTPYQPSFLHPNDRWVALRGDKDYLFEILDLETGKSLRTLTGSDCDTYYGEPQLFFDPSGQFLVMLYNGHHDYFLRAWELQKEGKPVNLDQDLISKLQAVKFEVPAGTTTEFGVPPFTLPSPGGIVRFTDRDLDLRSFKLVQRRTVPFKGPFLGLAPQASETRCRDGHAWILEGSQGPFRTVKSSAVTTTAVRVGLLPMDWYHHEAMGGGKTCIVAPRRTAHSVLVRSGYSTVREIQCSTGKMVRCVSASMPQAGLLAFGKSRNEIYAARPLDATVRWNRLAQPKMIKHPYLEEIEKPPLEELGTPIKTESGIAFDMGTRAIAYGGSRLAIGRDDGSVTLGNAIARQGGPWEPLGKHPASVRAMAFSSEQPWLLTGAKDGSLRVWDVATKAPLQTLPGHEARVNSVSIGPGNLAASAGPDGIRISDLASGKLLRHIDTGGVWVSDVHFSPDGHAVVAALLDGSLGTWDAVTGTRRWRVDAEEGWCATARYHPEGRMVASGHELGAVVLWDAAKGTRLRKTRTDGKTAWQTGCRSVHALAWSPTGDVLAVCFGDAVRVYDTQLTSGRGPGWLLPLDWADYYT